MGLYALRTTPLMTAVISSIESGYHSHNRPFHDVAFANDVLGNGNLESLKRWCDENRNTVSFHWTLR